MTRLMSIVLVSYLRESQSFIENYEAKQHNYFKICKPFLIYIGF